MSKAEDSEQLRNKLEGLKHFSSSGFLVWCTDHLPMQTASSSTGWHSLTIPIPSSNTNAATDKCYNTAPPPPPPPPPPLPPHPPPPPPPPPHSSQNLHQGPFSWKLGKKVWKADVVFIQAQGFNSFPTIITIKVYKTKGTVLQARTSILIL